MTLLPLEPSKTGSVTENTSGETNKALGIAKSCGVPRSVLKYSHRHPALKESSMPTEAEVTPLTPLGKYLRKLRIEAECSQEAMAELLGISVKDLSLAETKTGTLQADTLDALFLRFGKRLTIAQRADIRKLAEMFSPELRVPSKPGYRNLLLSCAKALEQMSESDAMVALAQFKAKLPDPVVPHSGVLH